MTGRITRAVVLAILALQAGFPQAYYGTSNAKALQGRAVASSAPANGQTLTFSTATGRWEPAYGAGAPVSGVQSGAYLYVADSGSTDAYEGCPTTAVTVLTNGMVVYVRANTANDGPSTFALCALVGPGGATHKPIYKQKDQQTQTGDVKPGQIMALGFDVTADGGNGGWHLLSLPAQVHTTRTSVPAAANEALTFHHWAANFDGVKTPVAVQGQADNSSAAFSSGTNLAIDGSVNTRVSSGTYTFTAADVGRQIGISAGTGWTTGYYRITGVVGSQAELDRSPSAAGNANAGTWALWYGGLGYAGHVIGGFTKASDGAGGAITLIGHEGRVDSASAINAPGHRYIGVLAAAVWTAAGTNNQTLIGSESIVHSCASAATGYSNGGPASSVAGGYLTCGSPTASGVGLGYRVPPIQGFATKFGFYADADPGYMAKLRLGTATPAAPTSHVEVVDATNPTVAVQDTTNSVQTIVQAQDSFGVVGTSSAHPLLVVAGAGQASLTTAGVWTAGALAGPPSLATEAVYKDEFGTGRLQSGSVGALNWSYAGTSQSFQTVTGRPGVVRRGSTSSTVSYLVSSFDDSATFDPAGDFDLTWSVRSTIDSDTLVRVGAVCGDGETSALPGAGIWFEKLTTDTNWFAVARTGSSSSTRVDMGTATNAAWVKLRIRRSGANLAYSVNGGAEGTVSTQIPSAGCNLWTMIQSSVAGSKDLDHDYVVLRVTGLNR
jgi:hypothetical protein